MLYHTPLLLTKQQPFATFTESIKSFASAILAKDHYALSKAITKAESTLPEDRVFIDKLLCELEGRKRMEAKPIRIGFTGSPGVGKSTLIEKMGLYLTQKQNMSLAVLAVDPSSVISGGSILGDKTRMTQLSLQANVYIRPSPSRGDLGGVATATFDSIRLFAGHDCVMVETVGVGQSEFLLADLVDCFVLLVAPGAGDELQGLKRGITELADLILVNKFDTANHAEGQLTLTEYKSALRYQTNTYPFPYFRKVLPVSGRSGLGIPDAWAAINGFCQDMQNHGWFDQRRRIQREKWLNVLAKQILQKRFEAFRQSHDQNISAVRESYSLYTDAQALVDLFLKQSLSR